MADLIKEMREALADGIRRLITVDRVGLQSPLTPTGKIVGTGIAWSGGSGSRDDNRVTTGYDPVTGLTTVAFVLGVSEVDGDDLWSM